MPGSTPFGRPSRKVIRGRARTDEPVVRDGGGTGRQRKVLNLPAWDRRSGRRSSAPACVDRDARRTEARCGGERLLRSEEVL
jgi:hypothetical protein